jgi:hypothetical protein
MPPRKATGDLKVAHQGHKMVLHARRFAKAGDAIMQQRSKGARPNAVYPGAPPWTLNASLKILSGTQGLQETKIPEIGGIPGFAMCIWIAIDVGAPEQAPEPGLRGFPGCKQPGVIKTARPLADNPDGARLSAGKPYVNVRGLSS